MHPDPKENKARQVTPAFDAKPDKAGLSDETIRALIKLALLVRKIRKQQMLDGRLKCTNNFPHNAHKRKNTKTDTP